MSAQLTTATLQRLHIQVTGLVQGVGFRPFVQRLAQELELGGWVCNQGSGVEIEVEGAPEQVTRFVAQVSQAPPPALVARLETGPLDGGSSYGGRFTIRSSQTAVPQISPWGLPDLATCPACLGELWNPRDRRHRYPFINCTRCGPRYTIVQGLPYDRPRTTMAGFAMCPACAQEYRSPHHRRYHAQPNACPVCGPRLELWNAQGETVASADPIRDAARHIRQGKIVALLGLGGFHLAVDARSEAAVRRLRDRKRRPAKPLAVMYPSLTAIEQACQLSAAEAALLTTAAAPIVLVTARSGSGLAAAVAPGSNRVGAMLPYTPLHHLLLAELGFPVVATSGNASGQPICADLDQAVPQLGSIADIFLVHNRPIAHPVDDSVVQVVAAAPRILRRARGYVPLPLGLNETVPCLVATGGHLKNTVALAVENHAVLSPHLGDLSQAAVHHRCRTAVTHLIERYRARPVAIACDLHPDYGSTQVARELGQQTGLPVIPVQHHYAHLLSALVDRELQPPVLGVVWDGSGYGPDGTLWGGEWLAVRDRRGFERLAWTRPFPLPGGEAAAREPRRAALGLLYVAMGEAAFGESSPMLEHFQPRELALLKTMVQRGVNTPLTSSVGRLFDGVAALAGIWPAARASTSFEGEAAMALEAAVDDVSTAVPYAYGLRGKNGGLVFDWVPMVLALVAERQHQSRALIAARFHRTLVEALVAIARRAALSQVVLTGGCFQNRHLLSQAIAGLRAAGLEPYGHRRLPPGDGGLAAGQLLGAAWQLENPPLTTGAAPCV